MINQNIRSYLKWKARRIIYLICYGLGSSSVRFCSWSWNWKRLPVTLASHSLTCGCGAKLLVASNKLHSDLAFTWLSFHMKAFTEVPREKEKEVMFWRRCCTWNSSKEKGCSAEDISSLYNMCHSGKWKPFWCVYIGFDGLAVSWEIEHVGSSLTFAIRGKKEIN
jgi:hypothetical protein